MGDLEGRVAFVTGGGSGIGAASARHLASRSATVVLADVNLDAARQVAAEIGSAASAVELDVRDVDAVRRVIHDVAATHGRLDIGLNIAGIGGPIVLPAEYPIDGWHEVLDVNLSGVFYCMRAELELMVPAGRGSIVNMASIYGLVGSAVNVAYTAAKHGVVGLTRAAALSCAKQGVRINAVAPAVIETPLLLQAPADVLQSLESVHPTGRFGQMDEVAQLVGFLASDAASYCTGAVYPVDGAFTAV